jgi:uncharacterized membrane protein YczE
MGGTTGGGPHMAQRKPSTTRRTIHYYWQATRKHLGFFIGLMVSTIGFNVLLQYGNPYVMGLIVDRVSESAVASDQVFVVFGGFIAALILVNLFGQACSKIQDYTLWKLEIAVSYDLATTAFDALSNQSMSFHSNRFGGTLVSQTTKFMSAYNQIVENLTFPFIPVVISVILTCIILVPKVPLYVAVLLVLLSLVMGKFKKSYILSFATAFLYGTVLDIAMNTVALFPYSGTLWQVIFYIAGLIVCAVGVALLLHTYFPPEAYELVVKELSAKFKVPVGKTKTVYDLCSCVLAIVLSVCFFRAFVGVKWGTVLCAAVNGWLIGRISQLLETRFLLKDAFSWRNKLQ